jgi:hypothetical protein
MIIYDKNQPDLIIGVIKPIAKALGDVFMKHKVPIVSDYYRKGKVDGTAEQAQKDEAKFQQQHEQHESDRNSWKNRKQEYDNILDNLKNKQLWHYKK